MRNCSRDAGTRRVQYRGWKTDAETGLTELLDALAAGGLFRGERTEVRPAGPGRVLKGNPDRAEAETRADIRGFEKAAVERRTDARSRTGNLQPSRRRARACVLVAVALEDGKHRQGQPGPRRILARSRGRVRGSLEAPKFYVEERCLSQISKFGEMRERSVSNRHFHVSWAGAFPGGCRARSRAPGPGEHSRGSRELFARSCIFSARDLARVASSGPVRARPCFYPVSGCIFCTERPVCRRVLWKSRRDDDRGAFSGTQGQGGNQGRGTGLGAWPWVVFAEPVQGQENWYQTGRNGAFFVTGCESGDQESGACCLRPAEGEGGQV